MSNAVETMNSRITKILSTIPFGIARSEAARLVVAEIEESGPPECLAYALFALAEAYAVAGEPDRSLVPFARLSRWWESRPEMFDEFDQIHYLQSFNLMLNALRSYPFVERKHIEATLEELNQKTQLAGMGRRLWAIERFFWIDFLGGTQRAEAFAAWQRESRDSSSYNEAIENAVISYYLLDIGRTDEGIRAANRALQEAPQALSDKSNVLSRVQHAYLAQGDVTRARTAHIASIQHMAEGPGPVFMSRARARNISFLARSHNPSRAIAMFQAEQTLISTGTESPGQRWSVFVTLGSATTMLKALGEGQTRIDLTAAPTRTVSELDDWLKKEAITLGEQFDLRNGTDEFSRRIAAAWHSEPAEHHVDLTVNVTPHVETFYSQPGKPSPSSPQTQQDETPSVSTRIRPSDVPSIVVTPTYEEVAKRLRKARITAKKSPEIAAEEFGQLGAALETQGLLTEAGLAIIEGSKCAEQAADPQASAAGYRRGHALLLAGGAELPLVARVTRELSRALVNWGHTDEALDALSEMSRRLEAAKATTAPPEVGDILVELAELQDTKARVLATSGRPQESIALAKEVAETFASMRRWRDASFAFLMAGRVSREEGLDSDEAIWLFESAAEGFTLAHDRKSLVQANAELIAMLHQVGRFGEAEAITARLIVKERNPFDINKGES